MKVLRAYPPNFDQIRVAFPAVVGRPNVFFCYGDTVYNPSGRSLSPEYLAHERVHSNQQLNTDPTFWWDQYIRDPLFRKLQELPAHCEQIKVAAKFMGRKQLYRYIRTTAEIFSGPLYGNIICYDEAEKLLMSVLREQSHL